MKKFIGMTVAVSIFFIGIGALVQSTAAKFKSDEKALELVSKARRALGGDTAVRGIKSMRIVGTTTRTAKSDAQRSSQGETEILMQLPSSLAVFSKVGNDAAIKVVDSRIDQVIVRDTVDGQKAVGIGHGKGAGSGAENHEARIVIKKDDGTTQELTGAEAHKFIVEHGQAADGQTKIMVRKHDGDAKTHEELKATRIARESKDGEIVAKAGAHDMLIRHAAPGPERNNILQFTLSLLLTPPDGTDVTYKYVGEGNVDGAAADIINATFAGESYKIYIDRASGLPVATSFTAPMMVKVLVDAKDGSLPRKTADGKGEVVTFTATTKDGATHDVMMKRAGAAEGCDVMLKFSDYRDVNGVQLPFRWSKTAGDSDEVFTVSNYEINPANIAERFVKQPASMVKMRKPGN